MPSLPTFPCSPGWAGSSLQGHRVHGETLSSESGARGLEGWPCHRGGGRSSSHWCLATGGVPGPRQQDGFSHGQCLPSSLGVDGSHGRICLTQGSRPLFPEIISPGPLERWLPPQLPRSRGDPADGAAVPGSPRRLQLAFPPSRVWLCICFPGSPSSPWKMPLRDKEGAGGPTQALC